MSPAPRYRDKQVDLIDRHIESVVTGVLDGQIFAHLGIDCDALDADKLADAVFHVDDIVAHFKVGYRGKAVVVLFGNRSSINRRFALEAKHFGVGDDYELGVGQFEAMGKSMARYPDRWTAA